MDFEVRQLNHGSPNSICHFIACVQKIYIHIDSIAASTHIHRPLLRPNFGELNTQFAESIENQNEQDNLHARLNQNENRKSQLAISERYLCCHCESTENSIEFYICLFVYC